MKIITRRRIAIQIETRETTSIRQESTDLKYCAECAAHVNGIEEDQLASSFHLEPGEVLRLLEAGDVHVISDEVGQLIFCGNSVRT